MLIFRDMKRRRLPRIKGRGKWKNKKSERKWKNIKGGENGSIEFFSYLDNFFKLGITQL